MHTSWPVQTDRPLRSYYRPNWGKPWVERFRREREKQLQCGTSLLYRRYCSSLSRVLQLASSEARLFRQLRKKNHVWRRGLQQIQKL